MTFADKFIAKSRYGGLIFSVIIALIALVFKQGAGEFPESKLVYAGFVIPVFAALFLFLKDSALRRVVALIVLCIVCSFMWYISSVFYFTTAEEYVVKWGESEIAPWLYFWPSLIGSFLLGYLLLGWRCSCCRRWAGGQGGQVRGGQEAHC